jgi:hypothetical protein
MQGAKHDIDQLLLRPWQLDADAAGGILQSPDVFFKKQRLAVEGAQQIKNTESPHYRQIVYRDNGFGRVNELTIDIIGLHGRHSCFGTIRSNSQPAVNIRFLTRGYNLNLARVSGFHLQGPNLFKFFQSDFDITVAKKTLRSKTTRHRIILMKLRLKK